MDIELEWVKGDREAVRNDVERLGIIEAARWNRDLARDSEDKVWHRATWPGMLRAIRALMDGE